MEDKGKNSSAENSREIKLFKESGTPSTIESQSEEKPVVCDDSLEANNRNFEQTGEIVIDLIDDDDEDAATADVSLVDDNSNSADQFTLRRSLRRRSHRKRTAPVVPVNENEHFYDQMGLFRGKDLCDCLRLECIGCHTECPKCHSNKCAFECRVYRKWTYQSATYDGSAITIKNPLL